MKDANRYYSAAVGHREIPGLWLATFGIPGKPAQWVMDGAKQKTFLTAEEAELAGFRIIASILNRALQPQTFKVKENENPIRAARSERVVNGEFDKARVFKNFK
jgi:hypothetical protein